MTSTQIQTLSWEKMMLAATMRAASLQNMRKAATTLPDSDTGFVDRIPGSIWPNSIRLQDVLLILTRLRCFHVSHHMKMCKREPANATFIESLQTAKTHELSQLSNGTKRADRGASAFTQECLTLAISSCFPPSYMCGYPDICCDIGHLRVKPFTEWPFRTGCAATVGKTWSLPNMYAIFCWQNNDENHFDSNSIAPQEKGQCWSTMSGTSLQNMRKAVAKPPDSDTWRVERVFGSIPLSIVTLQNVRLTLMSPLLQYH